MKPPANPNSPDAIKYRAVCSSASLQAADVALMFESPCFLLHPDTASTRTRMPVMPTVSETMRLRLPFASKQEPHRQKQSVITTDDLRDWGYDSSLESISPACRETTETNTAGLCRLRVRDLTAPSRGSSLPSSYSGLYIFTWKSLFRLRATAIRVSSNTNWTTHPRRPRTTVTKKLLRNLISSGLAVMYILERKRCRRM